MKKYCCNKEQTIKNTRSSKSLGLSGAYESNWKLTIEREPETNRTDRKQIDLF